MSRRYFDHVYKEICVAAGRRLSRYGLWLLIWEAGGDPDDLRRGQLRTFVEHHLDTFLCEEGVRLDARPRKRLARALLGFDPAHRTPEEWLTATTERLAS